MKGVFTFGGVGITPISIFPRQGEEASRRGGRFANRPYESWVTEGSGDAAGPAVYEDALDAFYEGFDVPAGDGGDFHGWVGG